MSSYNEIVEVKRVGHQVPVKIDGKFNILTLKYIPGQEQHNSYAYNTVGNRSCHTFNKPLEFIANGNYPTKFKRGGHLYEIIDRRK